MDTTDVLIVGAGISGLLCATELKQAGISVQIVDKGRGAGGRMTTRYMEGARLDHGAQFFTVREAAFQAYVDQWLDAGIVKEWFRKAPYDSNPEGYPRYCGIKGMNAVPKYLAERLKIHCSETVHALQYKDAVWHVSSRSGTIYKAQHLVLTAPLPQALVLLDASGLNYADDELEQLRALRYRRGLTTMAILEGPSGLQGDGYLQLEAGGPITWIADNQIKGISEVPCLTIQSTAEFADMHWDSPDSVRGSLMLEAAAQYIKTTVSTFVCHRWGFALSENRYSKLYFHNPDYNLAMAGDAFSGGRVEGAALSGIQAAKKLLEYL